MKKLFHFISLMVLSLIILTAGCKKNEQAVTGNAMGDSLTDDENEILENLPDTAVDLNNDFLDSTGAVSVISFLKEHDSNFLKTYLPQSLIGTNKAVPNRTRTLGILGTLGCPSPIGQGPIANEDPDGELQDFISRMLARAQSLIAYHPPDDGQIPKQNGLAYSYGSRNYTVRKPPPSGSCQDNKIYGLDCSGMFYVMVTSSALAEVVPFANFDVAHLANPSVWNQAFKNTPAFKYLSVMNLGTIPVANIQKGDIVIWPPDDHIAICALPGVLYQSNGYNKDIAKCCKKTDPNYPHCTGCCVKNFDLDHGPRSIPMTPGWMSGFGTPPGYYIVFRILNTSYVFPPGC
jgi:hypothetical protein